MIAHTQRRLCPGVVMVFLFALCATAGQAQGGAIVGRLTLAGTGEPVAGAQVEAVSGGSAVATTRTDASGTYRIGGLPAGTYDVRVSPPGYATRTIGSVAVGEGAEARLEGVIAPMELRAIEVVSPSRKVEDVGSAPGTVIRVSEEELDARIAVNPADYLRSAPGIDHMEHGIQASNVVARGFNNIFSGALHVLKDHRIASVPSLRVNLLHFIPSTSTSSEEHPRRARSPLPPARSGAAAAAPALIAPSRRPARPQSRARARAARVALVDSSAPMQLGGKPTVSLARAGRLRTFPSIGR